MTHFEGNPSATNLSAMNPVSQKLASARLVSTLPFLLVPAIAGAIMAWVLSPWWWSAVAVSVALIAWALWLIPAQVRRTKWRETDDELVISKGKLWHRVTVVPYGRIQFVDVTASPIARAYGLKSVELHTASASSDSEIPGLDARTADALRDRLAEKARERMSGL